MQDHYQPLPHFVTSIINVKWQSQNLEVLRFFYKERISHLKLNLALEPSLHLTLAEFLDSKGDEKPALKLYLQFVQNHPTASKTPEILKIIVQLIQKNHPNCEVESSKIIELISKYHHSPASNVFELPLEVGVEEDVRKAA